MMNRQRKLLPHFFLEEYEYSLYVDANIGLVGNPADLKEKYLSKYNMALPKHSERDCLYEESKECVALGRAKLAGVKKQINRYKKEGFPTHFGLGENNILFRKHNDPKIIAMMNDWWKEINTETQRDQLSLAYVFWKNNQKFHFMDESSRNQNNYFTYSFHKGNVSFVEKVKFKIVSSIKRSFLKAFV